MRICLSPQALQWLTQIIYGYFLRQNSLGLCMEANSSTYAAYPCIYVHWGPLIREYLSILDNLVWGVAHTLLETLLSLYKYNELISYSLGIITRISSQKKKLSSVIYNRKFIKQWIRGRHLGFQDGHQRHKIENVSISFVDINNVILDTKIIILWHL